MGWIKKLFGGTETPHIFAKVDPSHPHGGLDKFSESSDWPLCIRVDDINLDQARLHLCGKVINWNQVTAGQMKDLEKKKLRFTAEAIKGLFR